MNFSFLFFSQVWTDLKPQNFIVVLNVGGENVKLIDLEHIVKTGELPKAATTLYAAPELILGNPANITSDVWSFGVMVFES